MLTIISTTSSRVIITLLFGRKVNDGSWRQKYVVYRMLTFILTLIQRDDGQKKQTLEAPTNGACV